MTFRISTRRSEGKTIVRIEGRLDAAAVPDFLEACRSAGHPLRLDLSGLRSADADGVRALRALGGQDAELIGMSPYVRQLVLGDCGET